MNEMETIAKIFGGEYKPSEKQIKMGDKDIRILYCDLCGGFYIECPRCGNNCCNAGAGREEDGKQCIMCMKAYELQDVLRHHWYLIEELLTNGRTGEARKAHLPTNMKG